MIFYDKLGVEGILLLSEIILHNIHIIQGYYIESSCDNFQIIVEDLVLLYGKTIKTIEDIEDFNLNFLSLKINKEKIIEVLENFGGVKL